MKFIPPLEISSKIMTLIEEAEKEIILVSPYVSISGWTKMKNCLERAVKRDVKIIFFARENATQDLSFIKQIGIKLILVKDLHAKLYLNENYAIITSQNISQYSDTSSIDVGYVTEKASERKELIDFIKKYIGSIEPVKTDLVFEGIKEEITVKKVDLNHLELEFLFKTLNKDFPNAKLTKTSTYVFSSSILRFADVMIDRELTIKIRKSRTDFDQITQKIETILNNLKNYFKIKTLTTHKTFYYLTFIPADERNYKKIVQDYLQIIDVILKSEV